MKICLNNAHSLNGGDRGCVGCYGIKEEILTRILVSLIGYELTVKGHDVTVANSDFVKSNNELEHLKRVVSIERSSNYDLFLSIHFNCFNGKAKGTEIFTYQGRNVKQAKAINNNLSEFFVNRGVKDGTGLYVIRNTKCEAMLLEVCFIDNREDLMTFMNNIPLISKAIVEGLVV